MLPVKQQNITLAHFNLMGPTHFTCTIKSETGDYKSHYSVGTSRCSFLSFLFCGKERSEEGGGVDLAPIRHLETPK